jgi:DNA-binding transcriptional MerR regulator
MNRAFAGIKEIACAMGVHSATLRAWFRSAGITPTKLGRRTLYTYGDLATAFGERVAQEVWATIEGRVKRVQT